MGIGCVTRRTKRAAPTRWLRQTRAEPNNVFYVNQKENLEGLRPQRTLVNGVGKVPFAEYRVSPQINRLCSTWSTPDESVPGITDSPRKLTTFFKTEFPDNEVSSFPFPTPTPPPEPPPLVYSSIHRKRLFCASPAHRLPFLLAWHRCLQLSFLLNHICFRAGLLDKSGLFDKQWKGDV